jgi:hypothetical protein
VLRRFDTEGLRILVMAAGLDVVLIQGDGVVSDSMPSAREDELAEFELAAATTPPLRDVASRLHVLARRSA